MISIVIKISSCQEKSVKAANKQWSPEELSEQFQLGEVEDADDAFDMCVALGLDADELARLVKVSPGIIAAFISGKSKMPTKLKLFFNNLLITQEN